VRIAIVGSRKFANKQGVRNYVHTLPPGTLIISGACPNSPDEWAAQEARACRFEVVEYPAEWDKYGKSAGFKRNTEIVEAAEMVVAFWDGKSNGTKDTIDKALRSKTAILVIFE
jgi:hypothetical protein